MEHKTPIKNNKKGQYFQPALRHICHTSLHWVRQYEACDSLRRSENNINDNDDKKNSVYKNGQQDTNDYHNYLNCINFIIYSAKVLYYKLQLKIGCQHCGQILM